MHDPQLLQRTAELAGRFLESLPDRHVGSRTTLEELRTALGRPLTDEGVDPVTVIEDLAADADAGILASAGPRFFGFVIGGSVPAALAADWLVSTWDNNGGGYAASPALSTVEEVAAAWVLDVLGLPSSASVGFVTGCQMAHFTCLAAARHSLLSDAGWQVEEQGLFGAPEIHVLTGASAHVTVFAALRMLGLGAARATRVPADDQGRMIPAELERALGDGDGPTLVCAQAGEVNTGAFDPLAEITSICRERGAWCHVDGAFGLWAAASPAHRHLLAGAEHADSWATDGHKWLNVPYDSGFAIVADPEPHRSSMLSTSAYVPPPAQDERYGYDWVPEFSRRARGVPVYAALRSLGRSGIAEIVERNCACATRIAEQLEGEDGIEVLNDVVLNQVLVRFGADDVTDAVIERVQRDGTCWLSGTTWQDRKAMRISVCNWSTTPDDADRSAEAIAAAARAELEARAQA